METKTMKAVRIDEYGDENVLKIMEIPIPEAKADEVLVKVKASSVNPIDLKIRDGAGKRFGMTLPIYLGSEISGVVEQIGASITDLKVGDKVFGTVKIGGYAEYTIAKAGEMVLKPRSVDFVNAGCFNRLAILSFVSIIMGPLVVVNQSSNF